MSVNLPRDLKQNHVDGHTACLAHVSRHNQLSGHSKHIGMRYGAGERKLISGRCTYTFRMEFAEQVGSYSAVGSVSQAKANSDSDQQRATSHTACCFVHILELGAGDKLPVLWQSPAMLNPRD